MYLSIYPYLPIIWFSLQFRYLRIIAIEKIIESGSGNPQFGRSEEEEEEEKLILLVLDQLREKLARLQNKQLLPFDALPFTRHIDKILELSQLHLDDVDD